MHAEGWTPDRDAHPPSWESKLQAWAAERPGSGTCVGRGRQGGLEASAGGGSPLDSQLLARHGPGVWAARPAFS